MTSKKHLTLILSLLIAGQLYSQGFYQSGIISDSQTGENISNVNIRVQGTPQGTISNSKGKFNIKVEQLPATLVISHIGYEIRYVKISKKEKDLTIILSPKSYLLDSIDVSAERVINIVKDKPLYIWDYEIFEDKLLVLAYEENSMFRPRLILMDFFGDTLCAIRVKGARELYKDCLDNVHLIGKSECYQVYYDGKKLQLLYPYPVYKIQEVLDPCHEFFNGRYYVYRFFQKKQILQYFTIEADNPKPREFATYWDSLGLVLQLDTLRFMQMGTWSEADQRFQDMVVFAPVFAPLAIIKGNIYVFDYTTGHLEHLNEDGSLKSRTVINYHLKENWREELLVDDALGKAYTVFLKNGLFTLNEIDLETGTLEDPITVPKYPFIQKMQVYDGFLYFIYKEKNFDEYKKLFKMRL
ncbi:MAG: carboxypeptidase-like regulatory domain-containing protein [Bacteroidales bacterium]|nr:carboxypeptidase-like regulatory domain-containing protein [Bacteroidales bacterium]MCF8458086.1 carboxypeptidase-like regulatory domain-containing protein [Bacteroidales bacterium]